MPSDAALSIVVSGVVGTTAVAGTIASVFMNSKAGDRRARTAARRDIYGHFWNIQDRMYRDVIRFRAHGQLGNEEGMNAVSQRLAELHEAHGSLQLAGGPDLGDLASRVIVALAALHDQAMEAPQGQSPAKRWPSCTSARPICSGTCSAISVTWSAGPPRPTPAH